MTFDQFRNQHGIDLRPYGKTRGVYHDLEPFFTGEGR